MLSLEEDVEAHALRSRGWSISAIARHLARDPKTVRAYLSGARTPAVRARSAPDSFGVYTEYVAARLREDPHVWASALYDEVRALGYERSYQRFTHELRARSLRPHCEPCAGVRGRPTIEIHHPAGEEIQWDWLELPDAPWGDDAHLLQGTLPHSGKTRGVFAESEEQPQLIEAIDVVLRRLGGTARRWRFDRMSTVCSPGTGRIHASFAPVAKHYGVELAICPPRRANRKGSVEKSIHFATQRWWRTAAVTTLEEAQRSYDRFQETTGDGRRRGDTTVGDRARHEGLMSLPVAPYPATLVAGRTVNDRALVAFRGNLYSVPVGLVGAAVIVEHRLGTADLVIVAGSGMRVARHRLAPAGAGQIVRLSEHHAELEKAVLAAFTTAPPCRRKENRPPGPAARAAAAVIRGHHAHDDVVVDLTRYAELVEVPR
jgi:transposase